VTSSRWALLREELRSAVRQANHLVAAAVLVFAASILLGAALARPLLSLVTWSTAHLGQAAIVALGPLVTDGVKGVLLLAAAFPLGRILVPRPWVASTALVLIVYGLWFCFEYVIGAHVVLYGHWQPLVGRSTFLLLVLWATARLMARGRRVALEADRRGAQGIAHPAPPGADTSADHDPPEDAHECKPSGDEAVEKGSE